MAELITSVAQEKIKIRWDETYVSEGLNRKTAIFPPGLHDGGDVDYSDTVTLRVNGGTFVVRDTINGFGLLVRDPDVATINCSALFTAATTQEWYVGIRINYSSGSPTTGEYFFTDVVPSASKLVGKDDLVFFKVTIHSGDTGLDQATFEALDSAKPIPYPLRTTEGSVLSSDRRYGYLSNVQAYAIPTPDEKDALTGYPGTTSPSSANKFMTEEYTDGLMSVRVKELFTPSGERFQITGKVFVGNGSYSSSVRGLFLVLSTSSVYGDDRRVLTDNSLVYVSNLRTNDDSTALVPSTHADADGFYENPYVQLSSSGGTVPDSSVYLLYTKQVSIEDIPTTLDSIPHSTLDAFVHAERSYAKAAGTTGAEPYDRWTIPNSSSIQEALETLLSAVNETQIDLRTLSTTYTLVYRNGGLAADSGVTAQTTSKYVNQNGYVVIQGSAYIDSVDGNIKTNTGGDICVYGIYQGKFFIATLENSVAATTLVSPYSIAAVTRSDSDPFDVIMRWGNGSVEYFNDNGIMDLFDEVRVRSAVRCLVGCGIDFGQSYDAGLQLSSPDYDRAWITTNAFYSSSGFDVKTNSFDAMGIAMNPRDNVKVFGVYYHDTSAEAEPWDQDEWQTMGGMWRYEGSNDRMGGLFTLGFELDLANGNSILVSLAQHFGLFMIRATVAGEFALYAFVGTAVSLVWGNAGFWGATSGGSQANVYYSSGFRIQNGTGSDEVFQYSVFEVDDRKVY
jgi:hypothetical protein